MKPIKEARAAKKCRKIHQKFQIRKTNLRVDYDCDKIIGVVDVVKLKAVTPGKSRYC